MLRDVYSIICVYFLVGALGIFFINRKQAPAQNKERWIKYAFYIFIVNAIVASIYYNQFLTLAVGVTLIGLFEIIVVWYKKPANKPITLVIALLLFGCTGSGFIFFARDQSQHELLFLYALVFTFDGFSQIIGQLTGTFRYLPGISPNKTLEGTIGGWIVTVLTAAWFSRDAEDPFFAIGAAAVAATLISCTALVGDVLASWYKRKCAVKDYSRLIPGHGGILDRFDSFIFSGSAYWFMGKMA